MSRSIQSAPRPTVRALRRAGRRAPHPTVAYRQRGGAEAFRQDFTAPETWHEPREDGRTRYIAQPAGSGHAHPVTIAEIRERLAQLPKQFTSRLEVVQLSTMTQKRRLFPCYGIQWGAAVYLYPIEDNLVERFVRPPTPQQKIEAAMHGATWSYDGKSWWLTWTPDGIRDFYLNNVLIHEVGHLNDTRNENMEARERYANWFAIEYGYRASRGRRGAP